MRKKILSVFLAVALAAGGAGTIVPAMEAQASVMIQTQTAIRTAAFNSGNEWYMGNHSGGEWGGNDLLVAGSDAMPGWSVASGEKFIDLDGTEVTAPVVDGQNFFTPRNAVVTFSIPKEQAENIRSVQLELSVRNVKQLTAGARLAVYANSLKQTWNAQSGKTVFGANGTNSGLDALELLGLTDAIAVGTPEAATVSSEQTITLKSQKLTQYVKTIAQDTSYANGELTFRIAAPVVGGVRIYSEYADEQQRPKLRIKYSNTELQKCPVTIQTVDADGNILYTSEAGEIEEGEKFVYGEVPSQIIEGKDKVFYKYNAEKSTLSVTVDKDSENVIRLVYDRVGTAGEDFKMFSGNMVTEEGAWCWFADPRAIHYQNEDDSIDMSYMGYIDIHGAIKATQYDHNTKETAEVLIRSNFQPDDHNNPTFLVLPDERIMIFYSRHTDEYCFYYRISRDPGDITTLGEEKRLSTNHNTTYLSPFILEDDPDHIYLTWRGINWHPTIAQLTMPDENDNVNFSWGPKQIVSSSIQNGGVRPYAKYVSDGKNKIHMTYTATHPDNVNPNPIQYSYIDIRDLTLRNAAGAELSKIQDGPFQITGKETDPAFVVSDHTESSRGWVWEIALDGDVPVIAMVKISSDKRSHDYYYAKWNGNGWTKTFLTNAGGKFHASNIELCYSGGMAIDKKRSDCDLRIRSKRRIVWESV